MGSNGVPSLADIQLGPGFYELHEVAQPGKLGSDGAIVEMYSANFEGGESALRNGLVTHL